ncbi:SurA N-terminal domain-containing protein [Myxococcota bacterium]|nr:SurA N-terminal domain-containing protein [Myxococcota bacterium]MBU1381430.1 SurA N-terminal domain-containing protein [Myxococcota bacterium]MBU1498157.1 SurA N-terminal domain-containing protein [Myxococcota bacterium]
MLDILRTKSQSIVIYLILGAIILTFVISFGPASNKLSCGDSDKYGSIDGQNISTQDWNYSFHFTGWMLRDERKTTYSVTLNRFALDKILERKLLAKLADKNGIRFTRRDAEDLIMNNRVIIFGQEYPLSYWGGFPIDPKTKKPANFNYQWFHNWVRRIQGFYDVNHFLDQQVEELSAMTYKYTFLFGHGNLSNENWITYQTENIGMLYKTAIFSPDNFKNGIMVGDEEIAAFLKSPEGKKSAEEELKKNNKKYSDMPLMRKVRTLLVRNADFYAKVKDQKDQSLDALEKALPEFADKIKGLKDMKAKLTGENMAQAVTDIGADKVDYKLMGWVEEVSSSLEKEVKSTIFKGKVGAIEGPIFVKDGALFVFVEQEKGGKASPDEALKRAANQLIINTKADKLASETASRVLDELKKGKKPTDIKDLPELMTEGPISPLKGNPPRITRETAREIWNLDKKGTVLPKVLTEKQGNSKGYRIVILEEKQLPSKTDFEAMEKEQKNKMTARSIKAYDKAIKYMCRKLVRNNKLEIRPELRRALSFKLDRKVKPEEAAKLPPEKYTPCFYTGISNNI